MHPELLERACDLESGRALLDDEQVVALVAALAVGLGDDEGPVAPGAARDEDLPAVLGWVAQAEETELAEAFEDGVRERFFLPLFEVRLDLGGEELPDVEPQ